MNINLVNKLKRGEDFCRQCLTPNLKEVYNFGNMPRANELPYTRDGKVNSYPLDFKICLNCGLGQVGEPVMAHELFDDYRYLSSTSSTWNKHASDYADRMISDLNLTSKDYVLEIASNDGYLLRFFKEKGINCIGVEPSKNVSSIANNNGIKTITKFFGLQTAKEIFEEFGIPRLIIANNVLAHVPDINDFFQGLKTLLGEMTLVTIENPSILNILVKNQFDTIYHEHFSYLSANSVSKLAEQHDMTLVLIEEIETHGGTNRYFLRAINQVIVDEKVKYIINKEVKLGLFDVKSWDSASKRIDETIKSIKEWLSNKYLSNNKVIGFAAAAKCSTLINSTKTDIKNLVAVIDNGVEKRGRYIPEPMIPIIDIAQAKRIYPSDVIIFSWNIAQEIKTIIDVEFGKSVKCWVLIPEIKQVD